MNRIDDNTLAAYLEGSLPEDEKLIVDKAVENDDELKAVVDNWIAMADDLYAAKYQEYDEATQQEANRSIAAVMQKVRRRAQAADRVACCQAPARAYSMPHKRKLEEETSKKKGWPLYQKIIVAASLVAFVGATGVVLLNLNSNAPSSMKSAISLDGCSTYPMDEDTIVMDE